MILRACNILKIVSGTTNIELESVSVSTYWQHLSMVLKKTVIELDVSMEPRPTKWSFLETYMVAINQLDNS